MKPSYYEYEFETKLEDNKSDYSIIRTYLERDDQDDCIKNMWTVIAETKDGQFTQLHKLESKLPTYTFGCPSPKIVDEVILKEINSWHLL